MLVNRKIKSVFILATRRWRVVAAFINIINVMLKPKRGGRGSCSANALL
jgi:hypothetical protein